MSNTFHITTAIPYVNAKPHLGHVLEWFQADAIARYQRMLGKEVSFTSGADENSLKNVQAAEKAGKDPQAWLDEYAEIFEQAYRDFNISLTGFRRGSDQEYHWPGVQKLWRLCAHDMYKKTYKGLYCVGCEMFYDKSELVEGKCPEHLVEPEEVEEENYFFRLSNYQDQILQLIESDELEIVSDQFKQEMIGFIKTGLEDFSVSRTKERARGFGVPVPNDENQVMYVWFDALTIYMTAIGWGYDQDLFAKFWPANVHVIGKGINRFHSIYWIGMLLSAGLPLPKTIFVHGYITAEGQKMSKSLGNVVDPFALVAEYGLEPVRYYLLAQIPSHSDGDYSQEKFITAYTAFLANGLGNLCSRVAKLASTSDGTFPNESVNFQPEFQELMTRHQLDQALNWVFDQVKSWDEYLSTHKPWEKSDKERVELLLPVVQGIRQVAYHLQPFLPETAEKILEHFSEEKIGELKPLFPRIVG